MGTLFGIAAVLWAVGTVSAQLYRIRCDYRIDLADAAALR